MLKVIERLEVEQVLVDGQLVVLQYTEINDAIDDIELINDAIDEDDEHEEFEDAEQNQNHEIDEYENVVVCLENYNGILDEDDEHQEAHILVDEVEIDDADEVGIDVLDAVMRHIIEVEVDETH